MPKLVLLAVGKIKNKATSSLVAEYSERLAHYLPFEMKEIKDSNQKEESLALQSQLKPGDLLVVLDERGKQVTSKGLAEQLENDLNRGFKRLVFMIGGAFGMTPELRSRATRVWALSSLTLPHELARVLALEQLYRAMTILKGEKYHHE